MGKGSDKGSKEGWKRTALGEVYRFPSTRSQKIPLGTPRLTLKNRLFSIWYPDYSPYLIDEVSTARQVRSSMRRILGAKKDIVIAVNGNRDVSKKTNRYCIEYYCLLPTSTVPNAEQIAEIKKICSTPIPISE